MMAVTFRICSFALLALLKCMPPCHTLAGPLQHKDVIKKAISQYNTEIRNLQFRYLFGIDKTVPKFTKLVPPIMGADVSPLGFGESVRACKLINRIKTIAEIEGITDGISSLLDTKQAAANRIACPFVVPTCEHSVYRSHSGTCNNEAHPLWGSAFIPFIRLLDPVYESESGNNSNFRRNDLPRQSGSINDLPSARHVSNVVHASSETPVETTLTAQFTAFGQFVSHDIADTPMEKGFKGAKIACCNALIGTPSCASIDIPEGDFFRTFNRACMGFARSTEVTDIDCQIGHRQQLNIASSFVDSTGIYGHNDAHAAELRAERGLLKTSFPNHLPFQAHPNQKAFSMGINMFKSGDEKVSEFIGLTAVTTLFVREHNRVAEILADRQWSSEQTYQEARRVVIALIAHIVYNEYVPLVVGPMHAAKYNLSPSLRGDYYGGYDPSINPTLSNEIATGGMRFGHSQVPNEYSVVDRSYIDTGDSLRLRKIYWRSNFYLLYENGFQRGLLVDDSEQCDRHIAVDVRNHMFQTSPGNGLDLAALNIQRGRDHGLPNYNEYRKLFSLSPATEWSTTASGFVDMDEKVVAKFQEAYDDIDDLDLWSAGISERPVAGGQVGPLFAEMIAEQFAKLRDGDRFYYENASNGLSKAQLNEIKKVTMARVTCDNLKDITTIQPRAFEQATSGGNNDRVMCSSLPEMNLDLW